jgi:ABC-type Mn2+/Zn2+ transport system permease subunit
MPLLDLFAYDFMQRSLLAAAMVGGLCSLIGVFVVLRGHSPVWHWPI